MSANAASHSPRLLILGAGWFGRIALERLRRRWPAATITLVDRCDPPEDHSNCLFIAADAVAYLLRFADLAAAWDWIVPAVPVHVAGRWIRARLAESAGVIDLPVPDALAASVPHPLRGEAGQIYTSNADFLCPDDCPEPESLCTVTGGPRPRVLFSYLAGLSISGFTMIVLRSRQLAPGVGGLRPSELNEARDRARCAAGPVLIATACKCHGVIEAFGLKR